MITSASSRLAPPHRHPRLDLHMILFHDCCLPSCVHMWNDTKIKTKATSCSAAHCLFYWSKIKLPNWNKYHLSLLSCITETRLLKVISGTSILATSLLRLVNYLDCWIIFCWSQSRAASQPAQIIWVCLDILVFQFYNRHLSDIRVICQSVNLKQERTEKGRSFSQRLVKRSLSSQIGLFIVCQRHGFIAQTYAFDYAH